MVENKLLEQKQRVFKQAMSRQEPDYVPNLCFNGGASVAWAGKRIVDIITDPAAIVEAMTSVYEEMWIDVNLANACALTPRLEEAMTGCEIKYGPNGVTVEHTPLSPLKATDYDAFIADPDWYINEVFIPQKFPQLYGNKEETKRVLKIYAEEQAYIFQLVSMINKVMLEKYGAASIMNMAERVEPPLDMMFDYFRGFKGMLTDLRRQPAKVKAAIDKIWETRCLPAMQRPVMDTTLWGVQMPHIPAYLSPKQFDEYFWPHHKQQIERITNAGGKLWINLEGNWKHVWHHFLELPQDSMILHVDDDDIIEASKALGHHQIIMGGINLVETRSMPFDKIKDSIKRVIDTCAPGGGFLICTNKCWVSPGDVNQTLIDAYNFAHEYSHK